MESHVSIKPTYVDLTDDLKRRVKSAAAQRGITFKDAVADALREWLNAGKATGGSTKGKEIPVGVLTDTYAERNNESTAPDQGKSEDWRIEMAREVLNSEHPVAGIALTANIISFGLLVRQQTRSEVENADPATKERIRAAAQENERIRAAIERLRSKSKRFNSAM
jgi:transposase-like protein